MKYWGPENRRFASSLPLPGYGGLETSEGKEIRLGRKARGCAVSHRGGKILPSLGGE